MATDFVLEAVVRSTSASDAVGLCAKLLRQESTGLSAVTALLERIRLGMEEEAGIRTILQGIRGTCAPPSAVCDQLLQLLPFTTTPAAVVEAVPHFVGDDPSDVSRIVKEYKELLSGDRSMLVHIAGSLHDLPLDADTRLEVSAMTMEALSIVDEEDVPVVVRTLFKAARERESAAVVSRVRTECSELSMSTVAVLVDVMADAFSINESVARAFLVDITDDVASVAARGSRLLPSSGPADGRVQTGSETLSTLDVVGLLLLLSHRRHVVAVHAFLDKLYRKPKLLPTDVVVSLAERSGESPWACLASPVLELGLWAAIGSTRMRVRASAGNGSSGIVVGGQATSQPCGKTIQGLRRAGARILMAVFEGQPNARGPIVSCCLAVVGIHRLPPLSLSLSQPLAPIGLGKGGKRERESAAANALLESCSGALDLLLHLSKNRADLMSPFANAVGDLVLGGAGRSLHPLLLDKAAGCLASMMRHSNAMVNELMNHVQKQVFFLGAGVGGVGQRGSLASGDRGGNSGCGGFPRGGGGIGRFGDQGAQRRSAIVLATHLIRAGVLEERDADALLGWAVRLLSLLRGGVSSLDTVATTLELLVAAVLDRPVGSAALLAGEGSTAGPRLDRHYHGGNGSDYGNSGSSSSVSSGWRVGDERREGWARAGASTAGRCLVETGVLRMAGDRVHRLLPPEGDEELVPTVALPLEKPSFAGHGQRGDPSSSVAVLRARDIALAWWRGHCSMFESARTLHRSWLAALALSARSSPTSGVAPSSEPSNGGTPPDLNRRSSSSAGTSFSTHKVVGSGSGSRRGMTESAQAESWVRAGLSMPVWPFSEAFRCGEEAVKDTGGYWGLAGERRTAGSYELWRIPPTECAWQGRESTQRLVEAGAACIAARALLSATARHLLSVTSKPRDDDEGDEAVLGDGLVWRYLELGVRGRACVFALRRAARALALAGVRGNRSKRTGGSTKKCGSRAGTGISATEDLDATAARLEEGLSVELMPLGCLCRLVNNSSETRVAVVTAERDVGDGVDGGGHGGAVKTSTSGGDQDCVPSSIDLVAYTELLRTVAARLSGTLVGTMVSGAIIRTAPLELGAGESCAGQGALVGEPRMESIRALDVGALFRGAAACSRALPVVRKLHAAPNRPVKPERSTPSKRGSTPRKRPAARGVDPGRGFGDGTRRTRRYVGGTGRPAAVGDSDVDWDQNERGEGGAWRRSRRGAISRRFSAARWLEDVREKKEAVGEGEEEELSDAVLSEERSEESEWDSGGGASERDTDDDYDYRVDDNDDDDDEEEEFQFEEVSPRSGKKRKPSRGVRQSGSGSTPVSAGRVAGKKSVGPDPCRGTPGLSLCQFWRYRLLLNILLAARSGDEDRWEEGGGGRRDIGAGPRTKEVMDRLRFSTLSRSISFSDSKTSTAAGGGTITSGDGNGGTAARWGGGNRAAGDWVFSELSDQLERAEDGLLAAMIVEVMSVLSSSLGISDEVAALAWKGLRVVYPRGWGDGYSHLGGVLEGLRREGTCLLASPMSLRLFLEGHGGGGGTEGGKDSFNRFRGQLVFHPQLGNAMLASKAGLPSLPFMRHAFLCHWALAGRMGRSWALAAAVTDIEAFLLGASGSRSGHATRSAKKNSHGDHDDDDNNHTKNGATFTSSSPSVLCQENFDVFLATVVKLLPASIALATPSAVVIAADARVAECAGGARIRSTFGDAGARSTDKGQRGGEGSGKVARAPGIWGSPYEEAECLGMVLECLVEACKESLEAGAWAAYSSGRNEQLVALGRLLRRCVLPVARCCSQALRALEGQLERSLAWRCQQALTPEGSGQGGRSPSLFPHPGDSQMEVDCGAPGLCRGLLDQCDLCADGVRALCSAVRAAETCSVAAKGKERGDGLTALPSSLLSSEGAGEPHRTALDRVVKVIPGIVLQSDQLSTAVDNARKVLQIPRSSDASASGVQEMGRRSSVPRRARGSSRQSRQLRCASDRLSSLFVSGGGGTVPGRVSSGSSDRVHEWGKREKGRLSVGAELRGRWSRTKWYAEVIGQWRAAFGGGDAETGFGAVEGEEEVDEDYRSEDGGQEAAAYGAVGRVDDEDEDQDEEDEDVDQFRAVGGGWGLC